MRKCHSNACKPHAMPTLTTELTQVRACTLCAAHLPLGPRNNGWRKRNPWFEAELLPLLRARVQEVL